MAEEGLDRLLVVVRRDVDQRLLCLDALRGSGHAVARLRRHLLIRVADNADHAAEVLLGQRAEVVKLEHL